MFSEVTYLSTYNWYNVLVKESLLYNDSLTNTLIHCYSLKCISLITKRQKTCLATNKKSQIILYHVLKTNE